LITGLSIPFPFKHLEYSSASHTSLNQLTDHITKLPSPKCLSKAKSSRAASQAVRLIPLSSGHRFLPHVESPISAINTDLTLSKRLSIRRRAWLKGWMLTNPPPPPDIHEGTPLGSMESLHGLQTYISNPKTPPSGKVDTLIMITDIFGIYVNAKLLCDEWAGQGYRVLMPDLFEGDGIPTDMLNVGRAFNL